MYCVHQVFPSKLLRVLEQMHDNKKLFLHFIQKEHRKGRGRGSGRGKTSGRGHKGQGQRNTKPRLGFEGGNTPFYIRVPKHGFKNV